MKKLIDRLLGGIGILFLMIVATLLGHEWLYLTILLISMRAVKELFSVFSLMGYRMSNPLGYLATFFLVSLVAVGKEEYLSLVLVIIVALGLCIITFTDNYEIEDLGVYIFGILYIPFFFSFILRFKDLYIWMVYICAWGTDTFAYIFGKLFGKHKLELIERVSPKKTIEGSFGGIFGAVILTVIFSKIFAWNNMTSLIIITILGSLVSQLGDLMASHFKRLAHVKDYGDVIPGHGGILDRFDSILFVAPFMYYAIKFFL